MYVILIAPPAAGKGTQSEFICNRYKLSHISTGNLLREAILKNNDLSHELGFKMKSGSLIDNDIIMNLITDKIKESNNLVFDGFPRNLNQAKKLEQLLIKINRKIDYVIYLDVEKEIVQKRILGRRICPKCKKVYNINFEKLKPIKLNLCNDCNTNLIMRDDDNLETFENRFQIYEKETKPLIEFYEEKGILYKVDSSLDNKEIFKQIEAIIND